MGNLSPATPIFEPSKAQWEFLRLSFSSSSLVGVLPYMYDTVALILARAFRREIGGSAAALRRWALCYRVTICLWFSYLPDFHAGVGRVGVLERGVPIEGVHSPSL